MWLRFIRREAEKNRHTADLLVSLLSHNETVTQQNRNSCETNLSHNGTVDIVDVDFKKAFDKVLHGGLMAEINAHCIQGDAAKWIRNWNAAKWIDMTWPAGIV